MTGIELRSLQGIDTPFKNRFTSRVKNTPGMKKKGGGGEEGEMEFLFYSKFRAKEKMRGEGISTDAK